MECVYCYFIEQHNQFIVANGYTDMKWYVSRPVL